MAEHDVEAIWTEVWIPILTKGYQTTNGRLALDQIKQELYDYYYLRQEFDQLLEEHEWAMEELDWAQDELDEMRKRERKLKIAKGNE